MNNLSSDNIFIGCEAGSGNSSGAFNFAVGNLAGRNANGSYNTFIGREAGAGGINATGSNNFFVGRSAAENFTSGSHNIIFGNSGGYCVTTGSCNIMMGFYAGCRTTTGNFNIFLGNCSGRCNTTGSHNTFIGINAGLCNTIGTNNLFFGCCAGVSSAGLCNITTESNHIIMGNSSHTNALIQIGWTTVSDIRDKCILGPVPHGRSFLQNINPITFSFKNRETGEITDPPNKKRYGFSAQEILSLEGNDPVVVNSNPEKLGVTTDHLIPILVNAIKELNIELDLANSKILNLESRLTQLEARLDSSTTT